MTSFEVSRLGFSPDEVNTWAMLDSRHSNWPVVYVLDNSSGVTVGRNLDSVYVGESLNGAARMRQHLASVEKQQLRNVRVIVGETFNKSVCLDLESYLIRMLAGDGKYEVLNRNDGIVDADYYERDHYQVMFRDVFDRLASEGVFSRTIPEIENSDLFKLSPFKALTPDQGVAVEGIVEGLLDDLRLNVRSTTVVQGDPGTGKTVVALYLLKLLADIANSSPDDVVDGDSMFADLFVPESRELLEGLRIGLVIPQQSLRESVKRVFRKTPGLRPEMVMTAFEVGEADDEFDLLIVDESHRLNQRANQPSGTQNQKFQQITERLFGWDDPNANQLDWIVRKSRHQLFLLDAEQSVRPADLPSELLRDLVRRAEADHRWYPLASQMRVQAGGDYVHYIRQLLEVTGTNDRQALQPERFEGYEFRIFDSAAEMRDLVRSKDAKFGLSRMLAGYAWAWKSKKDKTAFDIDVDDLQLRWNSTQTDWIASPGSVDEVGSIHTVQGYDLNYAGVIIGPDLRYDPVAGRLFVDRDSYFDTKGKENNKRLGKTYSDDDLLRFVVNIYAVLLTRGIRGTYVYVCDAELRNYLKKFVPHIAAA